VSGMVAFVSENENGRWGLAFVQDEP